VHRPLNPLDQLEFAATGPMPGVPAISVLMPVRNVGRYLDEALKSLAAQTFKNFEIIAVDNGSTDATWAILEAWSAVEPRLRTVRLASPGLAESLNRAAALANSSFLARLDGDDVAHPQRLAIQLAAMMADPRLGMLGSAVHLIDGRGAELGLLCPPLEHEALCERHRTGCSIYASTTIMRADAFREAGGYRTGLNVSEDYDLFIRLSERSRIAALADPLVRYRVHDESITGRQPLRMALASVCVSAAAQARERGLVEPFAGGRPSLRRALPILGLSRRDACRHIRWRSLSTAIFRKAVRLSIPPMLRGGLAYVARLLRIRRLHARWLQRTITPASRLGLVPNLK
jgi:hypothetical protein